MGEVPAGQALLRSGAKVGDDILESVGGPAGAFGPGSVPWHLAGLMPHTFDAVRLAVEMPTPRVALGKGLRSMATSAIDVSDGLLGDLGHILRRSRSVPRWYSMPCPSAPICKTAPLRNNGTVCSPGAMTTNWCSLHRCPKGVPCVNWAAVRAAADTHRSHRSRTWLAIVAGELDQWEGDPPCRPWTIVGHRLTISKGGMSVYRYDVEEAQEVGPRAVLTRVFCGAIPPLHCAGAGSGLNPIAPGTVEPYGAGSPSWLCRHGLAWTQADFGLGRVAGRELVCGVVACTHARSLRVADPGSVVWDEIWAIWLVLWMVSPMDWKGQLLAVIAFRSLMPSPGPVGWADQLFKQNRVSRLAGRKGWASCSMTWSPLCVPCCCWRWPLRCARAALASVAA